MSKHKEPPTCTCLYCKEMCGRSCWPTPLEANALLGLGYGPRMMKDYWQGSPTGKVTIDEDGDEEQESVYIICGAGGGDEGRFAGYMQHKPCVFQTKAGLCEIHDICKPLEGRMATCDKSARTETNYHKEIAIMWESWEGDKTNARWGFINNGFAV